MYQRDCVVSGAWQSPAGARLHGGQAVRDDEHGAPAHQRLDGRLHQALAARVQRGRRLVQHQDGRVLRAARVSARPPPSGGPGQAPPAAECAPACRLARLARSGPNMRSTNNVKCNHSTVEAARAARAVQPAPCPRSNTRAGRAPAAGCICAARIEPHGTRLEQSARDGDALPLAPAEQRAAVADQRAVALWQPLDELGRVGRARGGLDLRLAALTVPAVPDVVRNCACARARVSGHGVELRCMHQVHALRGCQQAFVRAWPEQRAKWREPWTARKSGARTAARRAPAARARLQTARAPARRARRRAPTRRA